MAPKQSNSNDQMGCLSRFHWVTFAVARQQDIHLTLMSFPSEEIGLKCSDPDEAVASQVWSRLCLLNPCFSIQVSRVRCYGLFFFFFFLACIENVLITEEHKLICTVFHMCVLSLDGLISHKFAPEATFSPLSFAASLRQNVQTH